MEEIIAKILFFVYFSRMTSTYKPNNKTILIALCVSIFAHLILFFNLAPNLNTVKLKPIPLTITLKQNINNPKIYETFKPKIIEPLIDQSIKNKDSKPIDKIQKKTIDKNPIIHTKKNTDFLIDKNKIQQQDNLQKVNPDNNTISLTKKTDENISNNFEKINQITDPTPLNYANTNLVDYPVSALRRKLSGTVKIKVLVDIYGKVKSSQIYVSSGFDILDNSALTSIQNFKFKPATLNNEPVEAYAIVPIVFKVPEE